MEGQGSFPQTIMIGVFRRSFSTKALFSVSLFLVCIVFVTENVVACAASEQVVSTSSRDYRQNQSFTSPEHVFDVLRPFHYVFLQNAKELKGVGQEERYALGLYLSDEAFQTLLEGGAQLRSTAHGNYGQHHAGAAPPHATTRRVRPGGSARTSTGASVSSTNSSAVKSTTSSASAMLRYVMFLDESGHEKESAGADDEAQTTTLDLIFRGTGERPFVLELRVLRHQDCTRLFAERWLTEMMVSRRMTEMGFFKLQDEHRFFLQLYAMVEAVATPDVESDTDIDKFSLNEESHRRFIDFVGVGDFSTSIFRAGRHEHGCGDVERKSVCLLRWMSQRGYDWVKPLSTEVHLTRSPDSISIRIPPRKDGLSQLQEPIPSEKVKDDHHGPVSQNDHTVDIVDHHGPGEQNDHTVDVVGSESQI